MLLLKTTSWIRTNFANEVSLNYDTFQKNKLRSNRRKKQRACRQAEDLHLFPVYTGTLALIGDEVTLFYDILIF